MPRDAVSRTANVERTGRHKWVNRVSATELNYDHHIIKLYTSNLRQDRSAPPPQFTLASINCLTVFNMISESVISSLLFDTSRSSLI